MRIISKKTSIVKAETPPTEHKLIYLSGADHFVRPRHVPVLLFYRAPRDGSLVMPTEVLVKSLRKLLVHFTPLSGRLKRRPNSSKFDLMCNDAGAEFVEAQVDGSLDVFRDFQPNRMYTELLDPVPTDLGNIFERPVLYAQVTRFTCGSVALVASSIHTVTDGLSVNQFVTAWSELARGVELSKPPFHDRTLLKPRNVVDPEFRPKELRAIGDIAAVIPRSNLAAWPSERMFIFSPEQLKRAKSKAYIEDAGTFSTFQIINAHVWRSITKARGLDPTAKTKFLTTLDARKRVHPNLPDGYFGNAICFVSATSSAGEIVSKPLSYVAGLIRDAISGFTEDYMWSVVAYVENQDGPIAMNVNAGDQAGHDVSIASWVRMQFHEADFGSGKPILASPGNNPYDGSVIILPSRKGEGYLHVYISLQPDHMERLQADTDFFLLEKLDSH